MDYTKIISNNKEFTAYAPAKLNINLKIMDKDESGFHNICSTMQAISLHDRVTLSISDNDNIGMYGFMVRDNLAKKALILLQEYTDKQFKCRIRIDKSIPIGAGMGGGSSDAAAILRLANHAFQLELGMNELERIARKIGNDIPFLLHGGRAEVAGSNEHSIKEIENTNIYYLIARPTMVLNTSYMYELHDKTGKDFTELASELCPETKQLLCDIAKIESIEHGVTGKGPTVFAGYKSYIECMMALDTISWFKGEVFVEHAIDKFK